MLKLFKRLSLLALVVAVVLTMLAGCNKADDTSLDTEVPEASQNEVCAHNYGEWTQANTPACSVGYKTRSCSLCQSQEQEIVAPAEHSLIEGVLENVAGDKITARFRCEFCNMLFVKNVLANQDDDKDSLSNIMEIQLGTNLFNADSDNDGIADNIEVGQTNTNPLKADSDGDGLTDKDELNIYGTFPLVADSDGDGAVDGKEVTLGFNPLSYDDSFNVSYTPIFKQGEDTKVIPSINNAVLSPTQLNSLTIERDDSIPKNSLGYMGDAFKFSVDEDSIDDDSDVSMEIGFQFDTTNMSGYENPTIYELETNEHGITQMKPVDTTIDGNTASALVDKFTTYVLIDRTVLENDLTWIDTYTIDRNYDNLEIVFVMDDSGSMTSNDSYNERLTVARDLIDKLPANARMAVVKFAQNSYDYSVLTGGLISDKDVAKDYLTNSYFTSNGSYTHMYDAITRAFDVFESTDANTMRMMVVLTDGDAHDTSYHSSTIAAANQRGVNIYTIGLGSSSSSYFNNYLKPLAAETSGEFYYVSDAANLADAFNAIGEKISLTIDTDKDGLSDYYENNTNLFSGINYNLDMNDPDTDDDGLLDGEEIVTTIVYSLDGTQMSITGVVRSNPSLKDSDGDGIFDKYDPQPMNPAA